MKRAVDFREARQRIRQLIYDVEAAKELWKTGLGELGKDSFILHFNV